MSVRIGLIRCERCVELERDIERLHQLRLRMLLYIAAVMTCPLIVAIAMWALGLL